MAKKLHPRQKALLEVLSRNIEDPLTYREIQERIGASSTSVVAHHLKQLEKKGYLKRNPYDPRDYQVLADEPERKVAYLSLYGLVACGPTGTILDNNPLDRIPVPARLLSFPSLEAFLVKAKGNSMTPKIREGDIVIARRAETVESGRIAVCMNDGEALIKRIGISDENVILVSINTDYEPVLAAEDFRIVGEVAGVLLYRLD